MLQTGGAQARPGKFLRLCQSSFQHIFTLTTCCAPICQCCPVRNPCPRPSMWPDPFRPRLCFSFRILAGIYWDVLPLCGSHTSFTNAENHDMRSATVAKELEQVGIVRHHTTAGGNFLQLKHACQYKVYVRWLTVHS